MGIIFNKIGIKKNASKTNDFDLIDFAKKKMPIKIDKIALLDEVRTIIKMKLKQSVVINKFIILCFLLITKNAIHKGKIMHSQAPA